ncbi:MAG: hypothetical protein ACRC31_00225, partial [Cetobacterium sp.]
KNSGVPPSFDENVEKALRTQQNTRYNLIPNNCIHFALGLLDVDLEVIRLFFLPSLTMAYCYILMRPVAVTLLVGRYNQQGQIQVKVTNKRAYNVK